MSETPAPAPTKTIIHAMSDPGVFGKWFAASSWDPWRVCIKSIFGLSMTRPERHLFKKLAGGRRVPASRSSEALILAGRGSGKTAIAAMIGSYRAAFAPVDTTRQRKRVMLMAVDNEQAQELFDYVSTFFTESSALAALVTARTKSSITLVNGIRLGVRTANPRTVRGPSVSTAIVDEACFLPHSGGLSDTLLYRALRPAVAKVEGSLLLTISSVDARLGVAYDLHERYYGKDSGPLVIKGSTLDLNPSFSRRSIKQAHEQDDYSARAEYQSEWLQAESAFIERARVSIATGIKERVPPRNTTVYVGVDQSGGSLAGDAFAMAGCHLDGHRIIHDFTHSRKGRSDVLEVAEEFASLLAPYRGRLVVTADSYSAQWPVQVFKKHGIALGQPHHHRGGPGKMSASSYYLALLPLLSRIEWLDDAETLKELFGLIRTPDGVDHGHRQHDDRVNAACRAFYAASLALDRQQDDDDPEANRPDGYYDDEDRDDRVQAMQRVDHLYGILTARGYPIAEVQQHVRGDLVCTCVSGAVCPMHRLTAEFATLRVAHAARVAALVPKTVDPPDPPGPTLDDLLREAVDLEDMIVPDSDQRRMERAFGRRYTDADFLNLRPDTEGVLL